MSTARLLSRGLLLATMLTGCARALEHPWIVVPKRSIVDATLVGAVDSISLVVVAAYGAPVTDKSASVHSDSSRAAGEHLDRAVRNAVASSGWRIRPLHATSPSYFDAGTSFDQIGINYYGTSITEDGYVGRIRIPAFACLEDSLLRDDDALTAWNQVLQSLARVRRTRGIKIPLDLAGRLRERLGTDLLLIAVGRLSRVSTARAFGRSVSAGILTLGLWPTYEPSGCHVHAYLLDLRRGEFQWANATRINRAEPANLYPACKAVFARWPQAR